MARPRQRPAAVFADRRDAGRRLGELLYAGERALVVALPRGGVPVGFEVARSLGLGLDMLAVRKLGAPGNPELAIGAIAEGGARVLEPRIAERAGVTRESLEQIAARETLELHRQAALFRERRPPPDPLGRRVIVVDDGLATGLTMLVAVEALRERGAESITVAVPVGARESLELLRAHADEVVCHTRPEHLVAVGVWYQDFEPVSDEEVMALLREDESTPRA